jgi:hypothetical protein
MILFSTGVQEMRRIQKFCVADIAAIIGFSLKDTKRPASIRMADNTLQRESASLQIGPQTGLGLSFRYDARNFTNLRNLYYAP